MTTAGAIMARTGFGPGRKPIYKEPMEGKQVSLPPHLWQKVKDKADTISEQEERVVPQTEIVRKAVESFFRLPADKPLGTRTTVGLLGVIFGGDAQQVQAAPDSPSIVLPFEIGPNCYSLWVVGSSMESEDGISISNGDYAIFCPQNDPTPGALVHVEWEENGQRVCTFKKYIPKPDGSAVFRPLNPDEQYKPMPRAKGEYEIRGVFVRSWDGKTPSHLQ